MPSNEGEGIGLQDNLEPASGNDVTAALSRMMEDASHTAKRIPTIGDL